MIIAGHDISNPRFGDGHALIEGVTIQSLLGGVVQDTSTSISSRNSQIRVPMCDDPTVYDDLISRIGTSVAVTLYGATYNIILNSVSQESVGRGTSDLVIEYTRAT